MLLHPMPASSAFLLCKLKTAPTQKGAAVLSWPVGQSLPHCDSEMGQYPTGMSLGHGYLRHLDLLWAAGRMQEKCRATKALITDLELMANAEYFVGSSTSGLPGIVATMRLLLYNKSQITLADVTYNDMGSKVRRYWGLGGFQNVTVETVLKGLASSRRMRRHA